MTHPSGDGTTLDVVHLYPKNVLDVPNIEKTVKTSDTDEGVGNVLEWEIKVDIPKGIEEAQAFSITDELDAKLKFINNASHPLSVSVLGNDGTTTALTAGAADGFLLQTPTAANNNTLVINFDTDTRRQKLADLAWVADPDVNPPKLVVKFFTELDGVTSAETIDNEAELNYTNKEGTNFKPKGPSTVETGGFKYIKTGEGSAPLAGAKFNIYPTEADALAGTNPLRRDVGGANTIIELESQAPDGAIACDNLAYGTYWLVETVVPGGYMQPSKPFKVVVDGTSYTGTGTIPNVKNPPLPNTGGIGIAWFTAGGALLIVGGYLLQKRRGKKNTGK